LWLRYGVSRAARIAILAGALVLLVFAIWSDFPLCPMAGTLGVPCPGCGLTRATLALLHGDVTGALHFHPLVWLLAPLFIGFVGASMLDLLRDRPSPPRSSRIRWNARIVTVLAACLLVLSFGVWLARFAGYFGGPVPVTTLREWLAAHRR
jgi:hypothetical protein